MDTIREAQRKEAREEGYDLIFEFGDDLFAVKTNEWNEEKAADCLRLTGLKAFREQSGNKQLVFYDPKEWCVTEEDGLSWLRYVGESSTPSMPINMSSLAGAFTKRSDLVELDLSSWDVSGIVTVTGMCSGCTNLEKLILKYWDVNGLINADSMCKGCSSLKSVDLTEWHPCNLISAKKWFNGCKALETIDLAGWEKWQLNVEIVMDNAWDACGLVTPVYLAEYDAVDIFLDLIDGKRFDSEEAIEAKSF